MCTHAQSRFILLCRRTVELFVGFAYDFSIFTSNHIYIKLERKNVPVNGYQERPFGGKGGQDWFGVHWFWKEGEPAPMPVAPYLLEDVCDWRDVVQFPDLDAIDWERAAEIDRIPAFDRENNLLYQMIHNGIVERFQTLMGFEDALCALQTDQRSCSRNRRRSESRCPEYHVDQQYPVTEKSHRQ